jgi:small subunit ribosomal protein S24e
MELEIVTKKENPLLDRIELEVLARHTGQPTPRRDEVREQVAAAVKAKKDQVVVDHLDTTFGVGLTRGYVKVYKTKQAALAIEQRPIIARNRLETQEMKAEAEEKKAAAEERKVAAEERMAALEEERKAEAKEKAAELEAAVVAIEEEEPPAEDTAKEGD